MSVLMNSSAKLNDHKHWLGKGEACINSYLCGDATGPFM